MTPKVNKVKSDIEILWDSLQSSYLEANKLDTTTSVQHKQKEIAAFFKEHKNDPKAIQARISELKLKTKSRSLDCHARLFRLFQNHKKKNADNVDECILSDDQAMETTETIMPAPSDSCQMELEVSEQEDVEEDDLQIERTAPAQAKINDKIQDLNSQIANLSKSSGLIDVENQRLHNKLQKEKLQHEIKLKRLQSNQKASAKRRNKQKALLYELQGDSNNSDKLGGRVIVREKVGRPRLEEEQPLLLQAIKEIAISQNQGRTDEKRRTERLRSRLTLKKLKNELVQQGFQLSNTALYYRLLPKNYRHNDGKRHVHTVPVKLCRPQNSLRKEHDDWRFAAASINHVRELAEFFGKTVVCVISMDNKAKVPIGIQAAHLQSPLVMHLEYAVLLPDHDFVVASKHKLVPSVYAGLDFDENGKISYSGPTYIAVRSGKHDTSTAKSHGQDFERLVELNIFEPLIKASNGDVKPIVVLFVDGGPDVNPRYPKTLNEAVKIFKNYNLDALFVCTNAPHHSAYNPVERRMAPLSKQLAGVVLSHESCGSHLDESGKTIDTDLEILNFEHAGKALSEIWSENKFDGYDVFAEYINPPESTCTGTQDSGKISEVWKDVHVRRSQYLLQIVKCSNLDCCAMFRTNYPVLLPDKFLPPPILLKNTEVGIETADQLDSSKDAFYADLFKTISSANFGPHDPLFPILPYDYYCPSVVKSQELEKRYCKECNQSFTSASALNIHKIVHSKKIMVNIDNSNPGIEEIEAEEIELILDENVDAHIIESMKNWNSAVFQIASKIDTITLY